MSGAQIGILYNPISGRGKGRSTAERISRLLAANGFSPLLKASAAAYEPNDLIPFLSPLRALIVAGGDGTLAQLLPFLAETKCPVYMAPSGNESLFARRFSMTGSSEQLLRLLNEPRAEAHYFGAVNGFPFFSMTSVGLDSEVVQKVCSGRCGPLGNLGYAAPALTSMLRHRAPNLTIVSDGETIVSKEKGMAIVANSAEYALRLELVPEADSTSRKLCGRFFPYRSSLAYLDWVRAVLCRSKPNLKGSIHFCAEQIRIRADQPGFPIQADGDYAGVVPAEISAAEQPILVLHDDRSERS